MDGFVLKTRLDFVSNSSSSCYIVVTKKPVGQYTIKQWDKFFKNKDLVQPFYDKLKDAQYHKRSEPGKYMYVCTVDDSDDIASAIYNEYKNKSKIIKSWDDLT